ncbi:MAG TPA: hypothetical protein VGD56_18420, partial [Gemmatirosa sp.]
MAATSVVVASILGVVAVAASQRLPGRVPADDLRRDLDAAAAAAAFAPAARGTAPVRFVSPLELGESPAPGGASRATARAPVASPPSVVHARALRHVPPSTALQHAPTRTVAERTPAIALAPARAVSVTSAPATATPDAAPAPAARGTEQVASAPASTESAGSGTFTPGVDPAPAVASSPPSPPPDGGGVVIRGGAIGDADHCERDHGRGRMPWPGGIVIFGGSGGRRIPGR